MSFISFYHDRYKDKIVVWERTPEGRRTKFYPCEHSFYVPDQLGDYKAITGEKLKKLTFNSRSEFDQAVMSHQKRFESDLSPLEKCLMSVYSKQDPPKLVYGFVDIEVDYDPSIGFAGPSNPYAPINAITLYSTAAESYVTYAVPPPGWSKVCSLDPKMAEDSYVICGDEQELLRRFLDDIKDIDLISGWNSEFFDVPYIGKRIELLFGQQGLRMLGFDGAPPPRWTEAERFKGGAKELVLDLNSRVHIDYMRLFKKLNLEGRQSHALAAIANDELDIPKLHYDGSLYDLYRGTWRPSLDNLKPEEEWDELYTAQVAAAMDQSEEADNLVKKLSFEKFIFYNRRDVEIIVQIDKKFKYLEQANGMIHMATVGFNAIFGSVQLIDTAIVNFCHNVLGKIVFDKTHKPKREVEGALVMTPRIGLHKYLGSVDINSLYPSTYRSLNLSPEKIVAQLMGYEDDWRKIYLANKNPSNDVYQNKLVTLRLEGLGPDEDIVITAREMIDMAIDRKFAISGYGTVLDQSNGEGLLPAVLSYWFNGRKEMQAFKKKYAAEADAILKANGGDKKDPAYVEANALSELYDLRQGIRKVLLNSTYGATLNEFCRFHDPRLGASTTGSGRQITTFMIETIAKSLIGDDAPPLKKTVTTNRKGEVENEYTMDCPDGLGPIYSDTDSVASDSIVTIDKIPQTVEKAFETLSANHKVEIDDRGREFLWTYGNVARTSDGLRIYDGELAGIYRHKTSKRRFKITLASGRSVVVTEDHSIMIERDGKLVEVKPTEINRDTDVCISIGEQ